MRKVLDAHALMAYLEKEPGHEKVQQSLVAALEKNAPLLMTCVNFGEVYYIVLRECGPAKALEIEKIIQTLPIEIVDVDLPLAKQAAHFKATSKMSYADCFSAALAKTHHAELLTGDPEFRVVKGKVRIVWIA